MNTSLIRQANVTRVFHALRLGPGRSQRELSDEMGMDKATLSAVIAQLDRAGLISKTPRPVKGKAGRPEIDLRLAAKAGTLIGARLEPGVLRLLGTRLDGEHVETVQTKISADPQRAVTQLRAEVYALVSRCEAVSGPLRGLGVGVPALIDGAGRLDFGPNLAWENIPLLDMLRAVFSTPVYLDNDTNAAALAEYLFGSCQGVNHFLFIAAHSGVGGGLYLDGRPYRGVGGFAGEVGHVRVVRDGALCSCGGRGCLEAYLSETALLKKVNSKGWRFNTLSEAASAARSGDNKIEAVLSEAGTYLGHAVVNSVNLLNPERIILGGQLVTIADYLLPIVRQQLASATPLSPARNVDINVSAFGTEAVSMGGVALALKGFLATPL